MQVLILTYKLGKSFLQITENDETHKSKRCAWKC